MDVLSIVACLNINSYSSFISTVVAVFIDLISYFHCIINTNVFEDENANSIKME